MNVENGWLSLDPIYLSLLLSHKFSDNFSDMDVVAQGVFRYHLISTMASNEYWGQAVDRHSTLPSVNHPLWFRRRIICLSLINMNQAGTRGN